MKVSSTLRKLNNCPLCIVIYTELYQALESGVYITVLAMFRMDFIILLQSNH